VLVADACGNKCTARLGSPVVVSLGDLHLKASVSWLEVLFSYANVVNVAQESEGG
jgi:hypothetical protein